MFLVKTATVLIFQEIYSQRPRGKLTGIKLTTQQAAGSLTLAAVAKCLQAVTWLVTRGNKYLPQLSIVNLKGG